MCLISSVCFSNRTLTRNYMVCSSKVTCTFMYVSDMYDARLWLGTPPVA